MRVFVSGIAGFLGSHVARALSDEGHDVWGCDNFITSDFPENLEVVPLAVQDLAPPDTDGIRPDLVVHCAAIARSTWPNEDELWEHNVVATKAVLNWGLPVIFASSSVVGCDPLPSTYARTKAVAECLVRGRGGMALRFCNIYGPGQSEEGPGAPNVVAAMRATARDDGVVWVNGDPSRSRHFVHVTDAARAVVAAIANPLSGMWLDICGERGAMGAIGLTVASAFGAEVAAGKNRGDPHDIPQDPMPAKYLLGWEPKIPLAEGLREVVGA